MREILGRIHDLVSNKSLSKHQLILNLYKLTTTEIPKLPPPMCRCEIKLKNGKRYEAILEYKSPPFFYKDENDNDEYFWKVLSANSFKRHQFNLSDVETWMFV